MTILMTTVAMLVLLFGGQLLAAAALVAWLARRLGAKRATFVRTVLICLLLTLFGNVLAFGTGILPASQPIGQLVVLVSILLCELYVAAAIFRRGLVLPTGRTWIVTVGYFGINVLAVLLTFGVIRPYLLESFVVPHESMQPTVMAGDRMTANKVLTPRRFHVVVYRSVEYPGELFVKRLVGLPGETLTFINGDLLINGKPAGLPPTMAGRLRSTVPNGPVRYIDGRPFQLGPDEYFAVGDNVDRSVDSRIEGPIPRKNMVAVVELIYWPLDHLRVGL